MKIFLTGGGGFLGFAIAKQLVNEGFDVVSFSRTKHDSLEKIGVTQHQGDVSDLSTLKIAMRGCDTVFHVAAKTGIWGKYKSFYETNVVGTENIVKACLELNAVHLIYTSTASVVYRNGSEGNNESVPYSEKFDAFYPETKALGEKVVLKANNTNLVTCCLRPHLIWGPGDPHFLPRLVDRRRKNLLRLPGRGQYLVDTTYVVNAADAHLRAFKTMRTDPASIGGKAYFISQDEPITIETFINGLLQAAGLPPVNKSINPNTSLFAGWLFENFFKLLNIKREPPLTFFLAKQLSSSHWYDISAARRDFGYLPIISIDEGMKKLKRWIDANHLQPIPDAV